MEKEYYTALILRMDDMFIKGDFKKVREMDSGIIYTQMDQNIEENGGII